MTQHQRRHRGSDAISIMYILAGERWGGRHMCTAAAAAQVKDAISDGGSGCGASRRRLAHANAITLPPLF